MFLSSLNATSLEASTNALTEQEKRKAFMALDKLKYMELTDEKLKQVKDEADFKNNA